uniref:RRM domain-containing protein n=1 Tax=Bubo bubo TaxID=30461 RepID=A0A8C0I956_BUBBB
MGYATVYVGGLDEKVSEPLLWELFLQAGPVVNTHMPKDRVTGQHQGYGFVEFLSEEDADYAIKIMNMIKLYGKPIRVNKASAHNKNLDVGANIFIAAPGSWVSEEEKRICAFFLIVLKGSNKRIIEKK